MVGQNRALRPFWLHQTVEYLIGAILIYTGFLSPTPIVPAMLGGAVMLNAAVTIGPAGAFRLIDRRVHRVIDLGIIAAMAFAAVVPVFDIESSSRLLIGMLAIVLAVVWWNTDFASRAQRQARRQATARPSSEQVGRVAGRMVGRGVLAAREARDRRRAASADADSAEAGAGSAEDRTAPDETGP